MKTIPISIALTAEELAELDRLRGLASKSRVIGFLIMAWAGPRAKEIDDITRGERTKDIGAKLGVLVRGDEK